MVVLSLIKPFPLDRWLDIGQVLFLRVYFVLVHKCTRKERGQYPAISTEQAWSIKDILYWIKHQKMIFDLAGPREKSRASKIAPFCRLGSQSQCGIWFILLGHGASHIITTTLIDFAHQLGDLLWIVRNWTVFI